MENEFVIVARSCDRESGKHSYRMIDAKNTKDEAVLCASSSDITTEELALVYRYDDILSMDNTSAIAVYLKEKDGVSIHKIEDMDYAIKVARRWYSDYYFVHKLLEILVESNIDLKKIALLLLDLISREKPHDASRKECESATDLIREYCCRMQSDENTTEKICQYAYNATTINLGFTELSIHSLALLLHTNDAKYILGCFHYLSAANATNNEFFKIASSVMKRNFSDIELILSGKRTNMRVLQYNDGLP